MIMHFHTHVRFLQTYRVLKQGTR
eukprot:COSAG05_NODE_20345_length_280_cov_0.723757_2_plen_23_part_01